MKLITEIFTFAAKNRYLQASKIHDFRLTPPMAVQFSMIVDPLAQKIEAFMFSVQNTLLFTVRGIYPPVPTLFYRGGIQLPLSKDAFRLAQTPYLFVRLGSNSWFCSQSCILQYS